MSLTGKNRIAYIVKRILFYSFILLLSLICIIPLYWMVRSSFMKSTQIYIMDPFVFWPQEMIWQNYKDATKFMPFLDYTLNTIFLVVVNIVGTVLTSAMCAYSFSRIKWKGRGIVFMIILSSIMLPGSVTIISQFIMWSNLKLIDTYWPLVLPAFFGGGVTNIFMLRQFFMTIPKDMDESATIDGAGHIRIFLQIIIPLSKSAIIVVGLFTFLGCWNDVFGPIMYLNTPEKFTLSLGLLQFRGEYSTKWNLLMAASTLVVAPCIIVYLVGQKYLIEGITLTGLKA